MTSARVALWWRRWSRPWRTPLTLAAGLVALATPTLMFATSEMFRDAAGDTVATEVARRDADDIGVVVTAAGRLDPDLVGDLDLVVRTQLGLIDGLGPADLVAFTDFIGLAPPPGADGPVAVLTASGGIVVVSDEAVSALEPVASTGGDGIWLSERQAERLGFATGDTIGVEGSAVAVEVAGVFRDLWREGPRDPFWDGLPPALVPTFSSVFSGPIREIYVTDAETAGRLGLVGVARWDSAVVDLPTSVDGLRTLAGAYRRLERAATADEEYVAARNAFGSVGGAVPDVASAVSDTLAEVERRLDDLEGPLVATTSAGVAIGIVAAVVGGLFLVGRRRREYRLVRSDGDGVARILAASLVEHLGLAVVGAALGLVGAWTAVRLAGPGEPSLRSVDATGVIVVTVASLATLAATVAWAATRDRPAGSAPRRTGTAWLAPVVVLGAAGWIQVGRADRRGVVDPHVVAFPVVAIVAGVGIVSLVVGFVTDRARRTGRSLPVVPFLAWRRIAAAGTTTVALTVSLGASVGLVTYAALLSDSLERAVEAKVATEVGGETQVLLSSRIESVPPQSTIIRRESTRLTVGGGPVDILAIDTATYAEGVTVHPSAGASAGEIVEALATPTDADVAAVAVGDQPFPSTAGFGTRTVFTFDVVAHLDAAPVARGRPTLLVDARRLDDIGLARHRLDRPAEVDAAAWDEQYRSVLRNYRRILVSRRPADEVAIALGLDSTDVSSITSRDAVADRLENRSVIWSLDHLRLLAVVATAVALAGLVLYLAQQRDERSLTAALAGRMGLSPGGSLAVAVLEIAVLSAIAVVAGVATAGVVAGRIFDRFEPQPGAPPELGVHTSPSTVAAVGAFVMAAVVAVTVLGHLAGRRRPLAEVLRGA